ncbi:MAG: DpnI domain-containing protein [Ruegeria sp.]|nr:DpnI domain-containing protein [Ruegeria sp.]
MRTGRQRLGDWGEQIVAKSCHCPSCKKNKTLKLLPTNFKCADIICDFCGYLTQVKTAKVADIESIPKYVLGGAWGTQKERMEAAIYFSLYLVLTTNDQKKYSIYYLSKDLQEKGMFAPRKPLSDTAKRAGWQGFRIELAEMSDRFVRLL